MRATDDRIDVSKWEHAVKVVGGINGVQYCEYRNEEEYTESVVSAIFKLVCPDLMWEATKFKGKSKIHQWESLLRRKMDYKVLLTIDNVWNEDESREQAEALLEMGFHPDSLVMVTSRSREVLEWLGIEKGCCFEMPGLDRGDATTLLVEYAAPGCDVESLAVCERVAVDRVYVLVLGSAGLEQLEVRGCSRLLTVALPRISGSWRLLSHLNEQRRCEVDNPVPLTVDVDCCSSYVAGNGIDEYESLNLPNCRRLESLGDIGLLRSLKYLCLQRCSMLKALPDLSNLLHLKVVDLSHCYALEELGGFWYCRALEWLSCRKCRSLLGMESLCAPGLKVLDLSGCSKLESLCEFDSIRSLQMLNLSECVSLTTVPELRQCPFLEALNVKEYVELQALPEMSTHNVVIYLSSCRKLQKIPILNVVGSLQLDVVVGCGSNPSLGTRCGVSLTLTCQRNSELKYRDPDRHGQSSTLTPSLRRKSSKPAKSFY